jgi:class 3 adenylate cyclase
VVGEPLGPLTLKGFHRPVQAYLVAALVEHPGRRPLGESTRMSGQSPNQ